MMTDISPAQAGRAAWRTPRLITLPQGLAAVAGGGTVGSDGEFSQSASAFPTSPSPSS